MNTVKFLNAIRDWIVKNNGDKKTIVRLVCDDELNGENVKLVIVTNDKYLSFSVDSDDLEKYPEETMLFVINSL